MLAERLNQLGSRERIGLMLALAFLVLVLLDHFVVQPLAQRFAWLDQDIDTERKSLEYQESLLRAAPRINAEFAEIQARVGEAMPPAQAIEQMRGQIDELARNAEMDLIAVKQRSAHSTPFYDEYEVDIADFETDEFGLLRFLHDLVSTPGTFRVTRMKIAPDNTGLRIRGSVTVSKILMPSLPEPAAAAAPDEV